MHGNRNPCNSFLMVKMASGMDHGRVRQTTTTATNDVAQHGGHQANKSCSLGLQHISLLSDMHIMFNAQLSYQAVRWPVSRDHIASSGLELIKVASFFNWLLTKCWLSFVSRAHVRLTCWKQGRIVRKAVKVTVDLQGCFPKNHSYARRLCYNHRKVYITVKLIKCKIRRNKHF